MRHGLKKHPLYQVWEGMKKRCYGINSRGYKWYGAKGVVVCDEWKHDPVAFIQWGLANGYEKGLQIDKDILSKSLGVFPIYSPETCCFISKKDNLTERNKRVAKLSESDIADIRSRYVRGNGKDLAKEFGVSKSRISQIINERL